MNTNTSAELTYLRDRSLLIIDFIINLHPNNNSLIEVKSIIQTTFKKKDLRGMRHISRDVNNWASGLSNGEKTELEEILSKKFNENLQGDKPTLNSLKLILEKGEINDSAEYKVVLDYLESNSNLKRTDEEILYLKKLLQKYEG